jgi:hypothetical protein
MEPNANGSLHADSVVPYRSSEPFLASQALEVEGCVQHSLPSRPAVPGRRHIWQYLYPGSPWSTITARWQRLPSWCWHQQHASCLWPCRSCHDGRHPIPSRDERLPCRQLLPGQASRRSVGTCPVLDSGGILLWAHYLPCTPMVSELLLSPYHLA